MELVATRLGTPLVSSVQLERESVERLRREGGLGSPGCDCAGLGVPSAACLRFPFPVLPVALPALTGVLGPQGLAPAGSLPGVPQGDRRRQSCLRSWPGSLSPGVARGGLAAASQTLLYDLLPRLLPSPCLRLLGWWRLLSLLSTGLWQALCMGLRL